MDRHTNAKRPKGQLLFRALVLLGIVLLLTAAVLLVLRSFAPTGKRSHLELGRRYLSEQQYRQAQMQFTRAITVDDRNVEAYLGHGVASAALGDEEALQQDYEALMTRFPEQAAVFEGWRDALDTGVLLGYTYTSTALADNEVSYSYNLYGQCLTKTADYPDDEQDTTTWYSYNDAGQMTRATVCRGLGGREELHNIDYTYDAAGRIGQAVCTRADGTVTYTSTYSYNENGLLTRMESTGAGAFVRTYQFDAAGNCVEETYDGQVFDSETQTYVPMTTVEQYTYAAGATRCGFRLDQFGAIQDPLYLLTEEGVYGVAGTFLRTCDAAGNCLTRNTDDSQETRVYTEFGQLLHRQITTGASQEIFEYRYGSLDQALADE